jgi:hypothetical protein
MKPAFDPSNPRHYCVKCARFMNDCPGTALCSLAEYHGEWEEKVTTEAEGK